ncbi:MAG: hypothetical protein LUQ31_10655 [Methanoregula sp.]|nr:hypothetical protein [Methanoregula sp.]
MINSKVFFRSGLIALALILFILPVSAWSFSNWAGPANAAELQPGSSVSAGYTMSFSSYDTGSTFDKDDSIVMYTDLSNPQWLVTMTETQNDEPLTSQLANRQAAQIRLDGWSLSFSRKQFTVNVKLTGTVPALNQSGEILILRLQEQDSGAKTVSGSLVKKTALVIVPTPEPTIVPATQQEPETVIEITPEPVTTVTTSIPTKKQTYAPGPDPLMVCGVLAGLIFAAGYLQRRY